MILNSDNKAKKVVVIGAGIGGLATAALLAKDGYKVAVIEKNDQLGGRGRLYQAEGFTFDMGPSWYMMPEIFEKFFGFFGKKVGDYYKLKRLETHYKVFFSPTESYEIKSDLGQNKKLFARLENDGDKKLEKILGHSQKIYEESMKQLVYSDYQSIKPLLKISIIRNLLSFGFFKSFHSYIASVLKNKQLQKILEFTTVFLGGSPYITPAFYTLIAHTDFNLGIWYPLGGIHSFISGLEKLCREQGVKIITGEAVQKIIVNNGAAERVITGKNEYVADIIVANADYHFCETNLLEKCWQSYPENYWKKRVLSPSAFLIYLGILGKLKNASHHNLYFDQSWEDHFQEVYEKPGWPENPSYYVHCPSRTDSTITPPGCEALIFLVPVAPGLKDENEIREKFSAKIISHFENLIGEKISGRILTKKIFAQRDFSQSYNAYQGSAFGLAHTLMQTALFRPKNKSQKVKNLYYAGQHTNPGVGMPVCLISAEITANLIKKDSL